MPSCSFLSLSNGVSSSVTVASVPSSFAPFPSPGLLLLLLRGRLYIFDEEECCCSSSLEYAASTIIKLTIDHTGLYSMYSYWHGQPQRNKNPGFNYDHFTQFPSVCSPVQFLFRLRARCLIGNPLNLRYNPM